jgi:hypothetical protein
MKPDALLPSASIHLRKRKILLEGAAKAFFSLAQGILRL